MGRVEVSRKRGDLIQMNRVMKGLDKVDTSTWFSIAQEREGAMSTRATSGRLNDDRFSCFH